MIASDQQYNTWAILTKYKMLVDKVNDLRTKAWLDLPPSEDVEMALKEAEEELAKLKAWIEINFETQKWD